MQKYRPFAIDPIWAMECGMCLKAYYGSYLRAGVQLIRHGIREGIRNFYWNAVYRFCDRIGWTRLQAIPNANGCFERHSAKCDKMNCHDWNCVANGIPTWFKNLTRMTKFE